MVEYYVTKLCRRNAIAVKDISPDFIAVLQNYGWPGNVRELFNAIERVMAASLNDPILYPKDLPPHIRIKLIVDSIDKKQAHKNEKQLTNLDPLAKLNDVRDKAIAETEHIYLKQLVCQCGSDIKKACDISGLSRSRLYELFKKYEIKY